MSVVAEGAGEAAVIAGSAERVDAGARLAGYAAGDGDQAAVGRERRGAGEVPVHNGALTGDRRERFAAPGQRLAARLTHHELERHCLGGGHAVVGDLPSLRPRGWT